MSLKDAKVVDTHAHAVLDAVTGAAGEYGPELIVEADGTPVYRIGSWELRNVRYRGSPFMDIDVRLAAMDRSQIDWQLLSPNPLTYFHYIPAADAIRFCRTHNDALAELARRHPDRFGTAAALPMQDIPAAIAELKRAVRELGMLAAYIGTDFPTGLDDPAMDKFYETVVELDVPLFLHPAPAGIDGPPGSPALRRWELDLMAGFNASETLALGTLLFGGVLARHPDIDISISHGGGAVSLLWGRFQLAAQKRPWAGPHLKSEDAVAEQLGRIWYDIHMNDDRALELLMERVGTSRLVYGTNFSGWDSPAVYHQPAFDIPLADNARRLLRAG